MKYRFPTRKQKQLKTPDEGNNKHKPLADFRQEVCVCSANISHFTPRHHLQP